jgi:hypothetical protein
MDFAKIFKAWKANYQKLGGAPVKTDADGRVLPLKAARAWTAHVEKMKAGA